MDDSSTDDRQAALAWMAERPLDVLVIGGGIVGSGVARDAAMRGLRVGLVDQNDFASGTSSRSSRLLHGGLRYLAQGRIGLVREASVEKKVIHRIAPHLAQPLAFIFPAYRGDGWPLWKLRIGVKLYDLLCGGRNVGPSSSANADGAIRWLPGLKRNGLTGAIRYYDGLTNDARLVLDTLRSGRQHGARMANYVQFIEGEQAGDQWRCQLAKTEGGEEAVVTARCVINAAGSWGDRFATSRVRLRRTKGVHLVVASDRLKIPDAVVMTEGRRILFAIPWGDRVILGTTDTDYTGPLERVWAEPQDIDYILSVTNGAFPDAKLTELDVISHWAGLRPLIADPNGSPSDISRSHQITSPQPRWIDVAGGKLTTYRLIAEQTVDEVAKQLGCELPPCQTRTEPLLASDATQWVSGIIPPRVSRAAVEYYCDCEWARHLDDVMVRRTSWAYYLEDAAAAARQVASWMAERLGWDEARTIQEWEQYQSLPIRQQPGDTRSKEPGNVYAHPKRTALTDPTAAVN